MCGASGMPCPTLAITSGLDETELMLPDEELRKNSGIFVVKFQCIVACGVASPLDPGYGCIEII